MINSSNIIKNEIIVRQSMFQLLIGITNGLLGSFTVTYGVVFPQNIGGGWGYLSMILPLCIGLWFIWLFIIWKVEIKDDVIHFTNCLGQRRMLLFEEIEKVQLKIPKSHNQEREAIVIKKGGTEFLTVPASARGVEAFIKHLSRANIKFE